MFEDPKFWLLVSFVLFVILMIKPFKSMLIGGLDQKIEEIKSNINSSLKSFSDAETKLKEAEKQTADPDNKIQELLNSAKSQAGWKSSTSWQRWRRAPASISMTAIWCATTHNGTGFAASTSAPARM